VQNPGGGCPYGDTIGFFTSTGAGQAIPGRHDALVVMWWEVSDVVCDRGAGGAGGHGGVSTGGNGGQGGNGALIIGNGGDGGNAGLGSPEGTAGAGGTGSLLLLGAQGNNGMT
jgi:hypothetical protein